MNKIISVGILSVLFALPFMASAASVTISPIPVSCSSVVFRGTASYTAPETLHIKMNSTEIGSFTSGDAAWSVTRTNPIAGTLTAEVRDASSTVIATASQQFVVSCGNTDPMAVSQPWGLTGHETPLVAVGTVVTDRYGYKGICDDWMPRYLGCFDVSNTEWYLSSIRQAFGIK